MEKSNSSKEISGKQAVLMIPLTKFFCIKENIDTLQAILSGNADVSLRLIDWFVTNYSKKNNVMYNMTEFNGNMTSSSFNDLFNVFNNYKAQLKSFNKKNFDPFCRRLRIHFYYTKDKFIITTVGQLNFFKWVIENHLINYIRAHMAEIEHDMIESISKGEYTHKVSDTKKAQNCNHVVAKEKKTVRKKRRELSEPMSKSIIRHNMPITITFD